MNAPIPATLYIGFFLGAAKANGSSTAFRATGREDRLSQPQTHRHLDIQTLETTMRLIQAASCIALTLPLYVNAAPAHVHGVARMDLAVDGSKLTLSMEIPLDNIVGFEHLPKTDKQKSALAESMKVLRNASDLFVPTAAADCKVEAVDVGDPFPDGKVKAGGHADFDANYVFRCAQPALLKGLETQFFKRFGRLHRIDVQRATAAGQGAATLTPEQASMRW